MTLRSLLHSLWLGLAGLLPLDVLDHARNRKLGLSKTITLGFDKDGHGVYEVRNTLGGPFSVDVHCLAYTHDTDTDVDNLYGRMRLSAPCAGDTMSIKSAF